MSLTPWGGKRRRLRKRAPKQGGIIIVRRRFSEKGDYNPACCYLHRQHRPFRVAPSNLLPSFGVRWLSGNVSAVLSVSAGYLLSICRLYQTKKAKPPELDFFSRLCYVRFADKHRTLCPPWTYEQIHEVMKIHHTVTLLSI